MFPVVCNSILSKPGDITVWASHFVVMKARGCAAALQPAIYWWAAEIHIHCSFHHQDAIIWHCFNAQPRKNCQQIILCFGIYAKVPFKGSQSLIYWETKILCDYSVRNSRYCRAIIAIFMVSSNAKHYWISSRHPILMNCWKFYLQWAIITVIWMIELEFWDFVTITHCSIQL